MTVTIGPVTVDWLGLATIRLAGQTGTVVYMDPGPLEYGVLTEYEARDGDLVLITHDHHYDPAAIDRVAHDDAIVLVHESIDAEEIDRPVVQPEALPYEVERVGADETFVLGPLDLVTTPAYNDPDGPHVDADGTPHHPPGAGCGYGVTIDGITAFWPGDTDFLPYHEELHVDLLLPPIGGTFTMDRHDAVAMATALEPNLVLPVHYDTFEAIEADAEAFVVDLATRGIPVVLESPV